MEGDGLEMGRGMGKFRDGDGEGDAIITKFPFP